MSVSVEGGDRVHSLTAKEGEEAGVVGLLSGLESQSKLSQLLEEIFGVSPSE